MKTFALLLTALALARPACADPAVAPASIRPAPRFRPGPALMTLRAAESADGSLGHVLDGSPAAVAFLPVQGPTVSKAGLAAAGGTAAAAAKDEYVPELSHTDKMLAYLGADACTGLLTCWKDAALSLVMSPFHGAVGIGQLGVEGSESTLGKIIMGGVGGALGLLIGVFFAPISLAINLGKGLFKAFDREFI